MLFKTTGVAQWLTIYLCLLQNKAPSRILFDQICKQLHLLEVDYFGLEYSDLSNVTVRAKLVRCTQVEADNHPLTLSDVIQWPNGQRMDNDD